MQTNRLYFPPLDINGANKSAHFYLVKTVWKYESELVYICTHAWRHISDPWTPTCTARWPGWGRGWAAHTRHHPTVEDTQPAMTQVEFMWLLEEVKSVHAKSFSLHFFWYDEASQPPIFIITLLPYDRWGNRICQLLFKTEHWKNKKYTFPLPYNGYRTFQN